MRRLVLGVLILGAIAALSWHRPPADSWSGDVEDEEWW